MKRIALVLIVGIAIGIAGRGLAHPKDSASENGEHVKVLATYDVKEKLDGKDATVTMVEVSFGPGQAGNFASSSRAGVRVHHGGHVRAGNR